MNAAKIITDLKKLKNQTNIDGMARYGINPQYVLGISIKTLREKARLIGKDHDLALELWKSGIHEARILATIIDDYKLVTKTQMNSWVKDFNSWDLCDQCCNNLFRRTPFALEFALKWVESKHQFTRRAGFVLMAVQAVHNKELTKDDINEFFQKIIKHSVDDRNFVNKAVNWALRQIGKRNIELNKEAISVSKSLIESESKSAKWIGRDAIKELTSESVIKRLKSS